jgi:hypothetical protein
MAAGGAAWMLRSVELRKINLALELQVADDALSGRVTTADGTDTDFSGWLGLVATIEALLADKATGAETAA